MQEAKELLQSLEALQAAEMTTPPPRETEEEAQDEPPGKRPRLRRKKSKRACADEADDDGLGKEKATPEKRRPKPKPSARRPPRSPPVTGGSTSSGLQAQETLVDNGEDAQPTFPSDELPTPFKSTQKDLSLATPKASSREPPIPEPSPKFTPKPSSRKPSPKASPPKLSSPKPSPKASPPKLSSRRPSPKASLPKLSSPKPSPKAGNPMPKGTPRKSLISSFDSAVSDPPGPTHVLSLAPPDTSDGSGDEILQYALQQKMVEVSSGEENWNTAESWYACNS